MLNQAKMFLLNRRLFARCGSASVSLAVLVYVLFRKCQKDTRQEGNVRSHLSKVISSPYFVPEDSLPGDHPDMKFMRQYGRTKGLPNYLEIQNMTRKELRYIYHSYLDNTDHLCRRKLRLGKTGDGGWEVCDDYEFRPLRPCVVYSFGILNDFSFDDDVEKLYGCEVFSFDPSMDQDSYNRSEHVHFFKIGLGDRGGQLPPEASKFQDKWDIKTLTSLKAMLGHKNATIDIIKIDIEFSEWTALVDILEHGELNHVRQLLIEFHENLHAHNQMFQDRLLLLTNIEALGFRRFHTHLNPCGNETIHEYPDNRTHAYEVYFVNTKFVRKRW